MLRAVDLRLGTPADTRLIAELMLMAGGGLFEQLLDDIAPGIAAEPLLALALAINQADSPFGCDNAIFAEREGRCAGMLLCFPSGDYRLPQAVTAFVPAGRLYRIEALIETCEPDSLYVHSLAVTPQAQRSGVARCLLYAAAALAAAQGFGTVSLHAWDGNAPAVALYRAMGFTTCRTIELAPAPCLHWDGPVSLLIADTAMLLSAAEKARAASTDAEEIGAGEAHSAGAAV